jgi:hypothetical protein
LRSLGALLLVAACSREAAPLPDVPCTATGLAPVAIDLRTCRLRGSSGGIYMEWAAFVRNDGPHALITVDIEAIARRKDGSELGRDRASPVGFREKIGWLYPTYGVQARSYSMSNIREAPASIEIVVKRVERERGEPPPAVPPWTPADVIWTKPLPPGVSFAIATQWCGSGVEGIGPSAGRVIFDCLLGVRNTGSVAAPAPSIDLKFVDDAGKPVDALGASTQDAFPLQPGDAVMYTAARGVFHYKRMTIEATPGR